MSESQTEDDPSIEDILDSIREIISDDDTDADDIPVDEPDSVSPDSASDAPLPEPVEEEDDIVELTDRVDTDDIAPEEETSITPDPIDDEEEELDIGFDDPADDMPEREEEPVAEIPDPVIETPAPTSEIDETVFSDQAQAATLEAFEDLARTAMIERAGQITLEDVVRQEVRPLLRHWLDENLSGIVERLLEKELQRISNRYLDD